uniref:EGF-like domain-containing protein n=1 Tax=Rhizochromulina marina TaxID=1034831 RepID=A0A7S2RYU0_9STRA|mmetsp:Transcript_2284/g.6638  ORF Transcript_2284/g.6638 Transcript_2284/m.6638 type:complete len:824 (+) Transcript_2284:184-2655(+)|eukprot:CAMPEP_0118969088 /NCGR_PEP_ID=MMETSP1173-20130426/6220_1 /TAXON_ID=1034831 /ORGANISM="Rhizochromulina marina cf, Strain CCMP1243" /LENGTH=823 /DNA_ID=CAMNT_0006918285 /DNA_START=178 /DNA_END=2649 /DNA_ORIENTATION=-
MAMMPSMKRLLVGTLLLSSLACLGHAVGPKFPNNAFSHCSYHGHLNVKDHSCICQSGWTGPDCSLRLCPSGVAWVDYPSAQDEAHESFVECSNMGYCDRETGICTCREGFEGPGCEYMSCPLVDGVPCGGRGQCLSLRQAGSSWDGQALTRPNAPYTDPWDADKIFGCVCDMGFTGYDCSERQCPSGDDPLTTGQQNEKLQLVCSADGGSFTLSFRGYTTEPIPYDAGYGIMERHLEDLPSVGDVQVTMTSYANGACGSGNTITIEFLSEFGALPALYADGTLLTGSNAEIWIESVYTITCDAGVDSGRVYLIYDDEISSASLAFDGDAAAVEASLDALSTLGTNNDFGTSTVHTVSMDQGSLCSGSNTATTEITIRSAYGNLYDLDLVNSLRISSTGARGNITVTSLKGTKENAECSNHGYCDPTSGTCRCDQLYNADSARFQYRWSSSDGYNRLGNRGDCGYEHVQPESCPVGSNGEVCSDHGRCDYSTYSCTCYDGYFGTSCDLRHCPTGKAWFEEPTAANTAHGQVECSNRGTCDTLTGQCVCDFRFSGPACEHLFCATAVQGEECSGHGRCLPLWRLAELGDTNGDATTFSYGSADANMNSVWEREALHGCHCDTRDHKQVANGPTSYISGVEVSNPMVGGWTGYDCSRRWCPTGDDPHSDGSFEVQLIYCTSTSGTFQLTFRRQTTTALSVAASASSIEAALEALGTVGDVGVSFTGALTQACDSGGGSVGGIQVTFYSELGDVPIISTTPAFVVMEVTNGNKEDAECSNRGICDYATGECQCMPGYSSSNGNNSVGIRRDCGLIDPYGLTSNPYYP